MLKQIDAGVLQVGYVEYGAPNGMCVVLLHGFPYDANAYSEVAPLLVAAQYPVIVPYLRGFGPTRFLSSDVPRSGQQAALGHDLKALLDALQIETALLAGYDWGGRAACSVAALWPHRVIGLVTGGGYNIQRIEGALKPQEPEAEMRYWYQYYFHGERGRAGLAEYRREFCRLLWRLWFRTGNLMRPSTHRLPSRSRMRILSMLLFTHIVIDLDWRLVIRPSKTSNGAWQSVPQ